MDPGFELVGPLDRCGGFPYFFFTAQEYGFSPI
jgi:hypothetical protein